MVDSIDVNKLYPLWQASREKGKAIELIDVRSPEEYSSGHIPGARLIALHTLMARVDEIPDSGQVFLVCRSGARSAQAADYLARQCGRRNLINVAGGTMAWIAAGYPVER
ncbi:rhodanese-like domain-containing protein [Mariprofundus erugo]|uniref:Rhodanese-like domain-containing protein n=1 Tax=Mariprofundus erugo TaxID=2528639 RepID=A0A5R9GGW1_9PROT|nr:rhodanese-like domain-containing protein [Mariprofundus erugo]TLS66121.1 rhodanese-like domain-containing protein [Mariprofundus erugo]TLS75621.1 rhodanese-like domain-containing protein [Mariprofundus erugo]